MKPCQNDKCVLYERNKNRKDFDYECKIYGDFYIINCELYQSEKQESGWGMFGKLRSDYGGRFLAFIQKKRKYSKYLNCAEITYRFIEKSEQEAIKIMQEIEKELNNG